MLAAALAALMPLAPVCLCAAAEPTPAQLARAGAKARNSGLVVRAWMLFSEAARLDPSNAGYRAARDELAPFARMLSETKVQSEPAPLSELRLGAAAEPLDVPGFEYPARGELDRLAALRPPPELKPLDARLSFELRSDEKTLYHRVANAYGVNVVFDVKLDPKKDLRFAVDSAGFREAMEALTALTGTFLFPVGEHTIFVARDEKLKRDQFEPEVALSVVLPDALDSKELNDASTAVKSALETQRLLLDGATRTVVIHDRYSKAKLAQSLLQALLQPRAQIAVDFELLSLDESVDLHYGLSLPTSFPIISLGQLGGLQNLVSAPNGFTQFLTFGGGATLFGIGVASATLFATTSKSWTTTIYRAQVLAGDGQPATLHVGEQYPIAMALNTGLSNANAYTPVPQTSQEDLGVKLKVTPHALADGAISLEVEAEYQTLGAMSLNSVPAINERAFKGTVRLLPGEWAVVAGIDAVTRSVSRTGIPGLVNLPFFHHVLSENTHSDQNSRLLVLLKPRLTRLPATTASSPTFVFGTENGSRVML